MSSSVIPAGEAGVAVRQDFGGTEVVRAAETAMAAMAAQSKALVEARFVVAMRNPRRWENIRVNVLKLCKDPGFAAEALYVKPLTATPNDWSQIDKRERLRRRLDGEVKDWPMGFSIRAIEAILFECGNFDCDATIIWEDEEKRLTLVSVIDLERNSAYRRTVTTMKTVERSYLKRDETPITTRYNTSGQIVYLLPANPQQIETSEAAGVSKALRTMGERLLPPHFKAEWRRIIEQTILDQTAKDPEAAKKVLLDNFAEKGVMPDMIERYLEHGLDATQPAELAALRKIYVALANAEVTWRDVVEAKFGAAGPDGKATEESAGAKKVKEALARKAPKSSPQAAATSGTSPAGQQPSSGQPGVSSTTQAAEDPQPQSTAPQQAQSEAAQDSDQPPADLKNLDDWPDNLEADWYMVEGVIFRWNKKAEAYHKWEPPAPEAAPAASQSAPEKPRTGRQPYAFPGRRTQQ